MQTVTYTTYKFSELSEKAQKKAIEELRNSDWYMSYRWYDVVLEDWEQKLESEGYRDIEIHFSGFGSQGDGANFTGKVDAQKWLEKAGKTADYPTLYQYAKEYEIHFTLTKTDHHYEHQYTVGIEHNAQDYNYDSIVIEEKALTEADTLEKVILEEARGYMHEIYRDLEKEYSFQLEDEQLADFLEGNDYDFLEDGSRSVIL